jgi:hypothetical protein
MQEQHERLVAKQKECMILSKHTRTPSPPLAHLNIRSTNAFTPPALAMAP